MRSGSIRSSRGAVAMGLSCSTSGTATRTGSEVQFAHFGEYLAGAIADPAADLDKDGQTSLLEAFIADWRRAGV